MSSQSSEERVPTWGSGVVDSIPIKDSVFFFVTCSWNGGYNTFHVKYYYLYILIFWLIWINTTGSLPRAPVLKNDHVDIHYKK